MKKKKITQVFERAKLKQLKLNTKNKLNIK